MKRKETEQKIQELANVISSVERPFLDDKQKITIKNNVLSQLEVPAGDMLPFSYRSIIESIRRAVSGLELSRSNSASLKERVFAIIESQAQKSFVLSNLWCFHKKLVSSALLVVMFFGMFSFLNVDMKAVRAANLTRLQSFDGGVLLERNGEFVGVYAGIELYENDKIITGDDGSAVINYFDDSLSRLSNNTQIIVEELLGGEDFLRTYVEISLLDGVVWSKVVNLVESGSSFVVEAMDVYTSARRAAFNVALVDEELEIGVYNRSVDISTDEGVENVKSGTKMIIADKAKEIKTIDEAEKNIAWVRDNLESDRKYVTEVEEKLLVAKMESVGVEVDDDFSFEKSVREDAVLFLTFDDVKKNKKKLDLAEKNFIAAQVKLYDQDLNEEQKMEVEAAFEAFSEEVRSFYDLVAEVEYTDDVYADELRAYVRNKILSQKKELDVVLPDSPIYGVRKIVDDLELLAAEDESEVVDIITDQAVEKLAVEEDVVSNEDSKFDSVLISEVVDEYEEEISDVVELIDSQGDDEEVDVEVIEDDVEFIGEKVDPEPLTDGPFGVTIQGDKPLDPFLRDIE